MDMIFQILFSILGLGIPVLIIGGIIYFIVKLKGGSSIKFSYRGILKIYFYVVILISVGILVLGGVSTLLKVGFGEVVASEFSYGEVHKDHRNLQERIKREGDKYVPYNVDDETRSLSEKVEIAMKSNLVNGLSLTIVGLFLATVHFLGRRWVEAKDEAADLLKKWYLVAGLVIFAVATIISLIAGVPGTLRYALLDVNPGEESPGESLSIAITALPVWLLYLVATIRAVKDSPDKES